MYCSLAQHQTQNENTYISSAQGTRRIQNGPVYYIYAPPRCPTSGPLTPAVFEQELLQAVSELNQEYPDRFRSLIANGEAHTFIQRRYTFAIGATTLRQWVGQMVAGGEEWESVTE